MLIDLSNKYLERAKSHFNTYKGRRLWMHIDPEDQELANDIAEVIQSNTEVKNSCIKTGHDQLHLCLEFEDMQKKDCLLEENGAELYSLTRLSLE